VKTIFRDIFSSYYEPRAQSDFDALTCIPRTGDENCHRHRIFLARLSAGMTPEGSQEISGLLAAWSEGNEEVLSRLMPVVYPELRRIARSHLARHDQTMESAALVNEAYLKLIRARGIQCESRVHFFALCAQIIRRILVDHARKRRYAKRGGDEVRVPLEEALLGTRARRVEVLALDEALASLAKLDPRKGRVVELRFFGGLSVEETAEVLGISPETVLRDWKMAKAWLFRELSITGTTASRLRVR
jgi:RNA polymerase sigma factor (TIGR02999 family)